MFQHQGIWLPDGETHLVEWMTRHGELVDGRGTYQIAKLRAALEHVTRFRVAVDVGAHVGLWSMQLAKRFSWVEAFEPVEAHRRCWDRNMDGVEDDSGLYVTESGYAQLRGYALGETGGAVAIHTSAGSSGDSWVSGAGEIPMRRLDSFNLQEVNFVKLDCEGYELFALRGARATLERCRPVVLVEQKPGRAQKFGLPETGAVAFLESLGYRLAREMSGDFLMVPG